MFGIPSTTLGSSNLFNIEENNNLNKNLFTFKTEVPKFQTTTNTNNINSNKEQLFTFSNESSNKDSSNNKESIFTPFSVNEKITTSINTNITNNTDNTDITSNSFNLTNENKNSNTLEIKELKKTIEDLKANIEIIKDYIKSEKKNNVSVEDGIYVKCSAHQHLLKECTISKLSNIYSNGFICDICNYKQQYLNEKFYHCNECASINGIGNFDLCSHCVHCNLI